MLLFESVCFQYPKKGFALRDISFEVPAGICAALMGPNGCGKTTAGKLAAGILQPGGGRVLIADEDIATLSLGQIGQRAGYLFQDPARQLFAPTVLENLTFPTVINGGDEAQAQAAGREAMAQVGLPEQLENRSVFRLSGGEKQRLALAGLLMQKPGTLILDEPTTGIDPGNLQRLGEILQQLRGEGRAILLITHDQAFASAYCQSHLWIEAGEIIEKT